MRNLATHGSHYTSKKKDYKQEQESLVVLVLDGSLVPPNPDPPYKTLKSSFKRILSGSG